MSSRYYCGQNLHTLLSPIKILHETGDLVLVDHLSTDLLRDGHIGSRIGRDSCLVPLMSRNRAGIDRLIRLYIRE